MIRTRLRWLTAARLPANARASFSSAISPLSHAPLHAGDPLFPNLGSANILPVFFFSRRTVAVSNTLTKPDGTFDLQHAQKKSANFLSSAASKRAKFPTYPPCAGHIFYDETEITISSTTVTSCRRAFFEFPTYPPCTGHIMYRSYNVPVI